MQLGVLDKFGAARSSHEVVRATSQFLEEHMREAPVPIPTLGTLRVSTLEDIDRCIDRLQDALKDSPLIGHDEDRAHTLLGYLLVASVRARQLT